MSPSVLRIEDVLKWTRGVHHTDAFCLDLSEEIKQIAIDSRRKIFASSLFIALEGPNFDAHDHLEEVARKGCRAVLVSDCSKVRAEWGFAHIIEVEDTFDALQELARAWRMRFEDLEVVAITGSNGKTIVKDMLAGILSSEKSVYRSPGSFNSQVGVALSLLGLRAEHEVALIEAGISQPGEMERLAYMIEPTCGVLTNIGMAHAAGLGDMETTAREKLKLFDGVSEDGFLVRPREDATLDRADWSGISSPQVFFGNISSRRDGDRGVWCEELEDHRTYWTFLLETGQEKEHISIQLNTPGRHNVHNAAAAAAVAVELGCSGESIQRGLASYALREMRLELHTTPFGFTILNDTYSSDPVSAQSALEALAKHGKGLRKVAILGDMLDLGQQAKIAHRELGAFVAESGYVDVLLTIGVHAREVLRGAIERGFASHRMYVFEDLLDLEQELGDLLQAGDVVLFKASGAMGLSKVASRFFESMGPTKLVMDLEALRHNYHATRKSLGPGVEIMPVVKSSGYGNDATRVSLALVHEGARVLAVAYADEGISLRRRGLDLPILVTNTRAEEADKIVLHDLTALVSGLDVVIALQEKAAALDRDVDVHIEVDTGMNRMGLWEDEIEEFVKEAKKCNRVHICGAITHFASADEEAQDAFTARQIERFERALSIMRAHDLTLDLIHASNTAAAWRFPEARYDMVRVGLGLYGLSPSEDVAKSATSLRPCVTLKTCVLRCRWIEKGESVGYGRTWIAPRRSRIATIAIGYNDGFPRFASNRAHVLIHAKRCRVVGNVCMDVCMVDVTSLGERVQIGDEVVLFGAQGQEMISIDELAKLGNTISYEILCNISERVRRIYTNQV